MKRKLKGKVLALAAAVLLIILSVFKIPRFINVGRLEKLGYSEEAITAIYQKGLRGEILKNSYYSDYLNKEVVKDSFRKQYLHLYAVCDDLNDDSFSLYEKLKSAKGYSDEELTKLYSSLKYDCLVPLMVFEKADVDAYIADVKAHPENGKDTLLLDNDYLHPYENVTEVAEPEKIDTYVSKKSSIGEYAPVKLAQIPTMNATPDLYLESRGLEAFMALCTGARDNGSSIYAVAAYRSYDWQSEQHATYGGGSEADARVTRPGYADAQLGLSVSVVASENESVSLFKETKAYQWLLEHAHEYGFIQRFPEGKESVTGSAAVPNYFRYVGEELAGKIHESGLTFDEYYAMYIK